jgi:hypothetical protein
MVSEDGGIDHAIESQLAVFRGLGFIDENNHYPGPHGRVGHQA